MSCSTESSRSEEKLCSDSTVLETEITDCAGPDRPFLNMLQANKCEKNALPKAARKKWGVEMRKMPAAEGGEIFWGVFGQSFQFPVSIFVRTYA